MANEKVKVHLTDDKNTRKYKVGGIIFTVEPVYKESGEKVGDILEKRIKDDAQNNR